MIKDNKKILVIMEVFLALNITIFVVNTFVFKPVQINGDSMYPTLENGEKGLSNQLALSTNTIHRFDIVVAYNAIDDTLVIKRVIGLPNETIAYVDDELFINGTRVIEDFLISDYRDKYMKTHSFFSENYGPITLKEDEYFLVGDNRPFSKDSRRVGPFKHSQIKSKDIIILYPLNSLRIK